MCRCAQVCLRVCVCLHAHVYVCVYVCLPAHVDLRGPDRLFKVQARIPHAHTHTHTDLDLRQRVLAACSTKSLKLPCNFPLCVHRGAEMRLQPVHALKLSPQCSWISLGGILRKKNSSISKAAILCPWACCSIPLLNCMYASACFPKLVCPK